MNNNKIGVYPPLSFIRLHGFGDHAPVVQISIDNRFVVLSNYHGLSPIVCMPELVQSFVGTQADVIQKSPVTYRMLLEKIRDLSEQEDARAKLDDPLLAVRAFLYLGRKYDFENNYIDDLPESDFIEAINHAIEQDDLIRDHYCNLAEAFINAQKGE